MSPKTRKDKMNFHPNGSICVCSTSKTCYPVKPVTRKVSHTPTPWKRVKTWSQVRIMQADETLYDQYLEHTIAEVDCDENAELIIRAVNSHEELLEVLKQLANVTNEKGMNRVVVASIVARAWEAIAKAEGK